MIEITMTTSRMILTIITMIRKEVNMVTVASIDELGSPSGDGAGGGEDNLGNILSVGDCCGHHCQQNNGNHYLSNVKVLLIRDD